MAVVWDWSAEPISTISGSRTVIASSSVVTVHSVFVYGTLKAGFPNHRLLPPSQFAGKGITADAWPLVIAGDWYTPVLIDERGSGFEVTGELYSLDDTSLALLDELEGGGAPFGFTRIEIAVDARTSPAWTYAKPARLAMPVHEGPLSTYLLDPRYVPGEHRGRPNRGFGAEDDDS